MTKLKTNINKLNILIGKGRIKEAFDKYYSKNVVIQVNGSTPINGKEKNRERELVFLQELGRLNSAKTKSSVFGGTDDNISMTEWAIDIEKNNGKNKKMYLVNVQHWMDDKIINKRLYFCGD